MSFKVVYVFLISFLLVSCSSKEDPDLIASRQLSIVCSNHVLADLVRQIAGDRALVVGNSHLHEQSDLKNAKQADLLVVLGEGCESGYKSIYKSYKSKLLPVLDSIDRKLIKDDAIQAGNKDCHFWFDDRLIVPVIDVIADELSSLDPTYKTYYESNKTSFSADVVTSFSKFQTLLNHVPKSQRLIVGTHDGFAYFGDRFSFETYGLWVSDDKYVTDRDISRLADFLVRRWVRYVFVESPLEDVFVTKLNESILEKGWEITIQPIFIHDFQSVSTSNISLLDAVEFDVKHFRKMLGSDLDAMTIDDYLSTFD
jgi:manganese/zinc/iron transport system substrate-binding protein